jgi:hypothetical protein
LDDYKRIRSDIPRRSKVARHHKPMPNVSGSPTVLGSEVVRIRRQSTTPIRVAIRVGENVKGVHRRITTEAAVEINNELILIEPAARLVLVDIADRRRINIW